MRIKKERAAGAAQSQPKKDYIPKEQKIQTAIRDILLDGEKHYSEELEDLAHCKSADVRNAIHNLRMEGVRVCSGKHGYWLWNGIDDSQDLSL